MIEKLTISTLAEKEETLIARNSTANSYINAIGLEHYTKKLLEKIRKEFYSAPIIEHKCQNCGGTVEWKSDKHIFICPYCKSVYALGTEMINDKGDL